MKKIKIALFTGNYNHIKDGVSLTLNRLVRFLEEKGHEVLIFAPSIKNPPLEHTGRMLEVPSVAAPGRDEYRISLFLPEVLRLELDDFKPDIIHVATPDILGLRALFYARGKNIPLVSSYHTHFASYLQYYNLQIMERPLWKYMKWYYRHCEKVFVPSRSMLDWLRDMGFGRKFTLWTRGVDVNLFSPEKRSLEWRRSFGIKEGDIAVAFVSRIVWEKDLRTVIDVSKKLIKEKKNIKILVGGDGPALEAMQSELPEAIYAGYQSGEKLAEVYAAADVFFFPSDTEAFGNVTLEAISCGVPAVVADAVGSSSIIVDGETGYIAEPKNIDDFTNKIRRLTDDADLRYQMSKAARKHAMNFKWDTIMSGLLNDYFSVIKTYKSKK